MVVVTREQTKGLALGVELDSVLAMLSGLDLRCVLCERGCFACRLFPVSPLLLLAFL
jgi:hypothetical protein